MPGPNAGVRLPAELKDEKAGPGAADFSPRVNAHQTRPNLKPAEHRMPRQPALRGGNSNFPACWTWFPSAAIEFYISSPSTVLMWGRIDTLLAQQEHCECSSAWLSRRSGETNSVHRHVTVHESDITISVRDPRPGFDLALPIPTIMRAPFTHGRGICLLRRLMSEVAFA
jgi:hypothetical protein